MPEPLLDVRDLTVSFRSRSGVVPAVAGLSMTLAPGEVLGVVGESGSGKSVSMMSVLGLVRGPNVTVGGSALLRGRDLVTMGDAELRRVRGKEVAMVFQDPMTALTPVYTVGWHIAEAIRAHADVSRAVARRRAVELLGEVGIPAPAQRVDDHPHQFSGGMRQRAVIAMALANDPALLIADEPTTALDVTTQAQILDLLRRLRDEHGSAIVMITHDMGVVSQMADRVVVMYAGRAVEAGPRRGVFGSPQHPYTWGLLDSVPRVGAARQRPLPTIPGSPVSADAVPPGCPFSPRCAHAHDACTTRPALEGATEHADHLDACWLPRGARRELRLHPPTSGAASATAPAAAGVAR